MQQQIVAPVDSPAEIGSTLSFPSRLPVQSTPFIGRQKELLEIRHLLLDPGYRLVTVLGPGGIGKTRLALEAAAGMSTTFRDGVYFVPLAPLRSAEHIVSAVADGLDFQFQDFQLQGANDPRQQLLRYLQNKELLLVLDNFEHVLEGMGLVQEMLQRAPQVKVLVTSRERLNLSGEVVYALGGMVFPQEEAAEDVTTYEAIQLLIERAQRVRPDLRLQDEIDQAARVCRLVQGMPLALVLAASWLEVLSLEEIADEIERNLDFLESTMHDVPERQRSVRATFEYSWRLLSAREQYVFMKLSVFSGPFSREAAEVVAGATLSILRKLVNKSLVFLNPAGRYEVHELLRQYGEAYLEQSGEAQNTRDAHSGYYLAVLAECEVDLKGTRQLQALDEIDSEITNVRLAWQWAVRQQKGAQIEKAIDSLWLYSEMRGALHEGEAAFREAVAGFRAGGGAPSPEGEHEPLVGFLLVVWGYLLGRRGQQDEGQALIKQGLEVLREAPRRRERQEATALLLMSLLLVFQGRLQEAKEVAEEALAIFTALDDRWGIAGCLLTIGASMQFEGQLQEAEPLLLESLQICQEIGDRRHGAYTIDNLAMIAVARGAYQEAQQLLDENLHTSQKFGCLVNEAYALREIGMLDLIHGEYGKGEQTIQKSRTILEEIGSSADAASTLRYLGAAYRLRGEYDKAEQAYRESLAWAQKVGNRGDVARCLCGLGSVAYDQQQYAEAGQLFQEALAIWTQLGNELEMASVLRYLGRVMVTWGDAHDAEAREHYRSALELALKHGSAPIALDVLTGIAELLRRSGELPHAAELLALVEFHPASTHESRERARRGLGTLATGLPVEQMDAIRARGRALDWRTATTRLIEELA